MSRAKPAVLTQQQQQQQQQHYDSSAASQVQPLPATNLPSWARDDDDQDGRNFRDENQPPRQSGSSSFNFGGGGGGGSDSNGRHDASAEGHKNEVSAESWAEMYRKQRARRRKGGAK